MFHSFMFTTACSLHMTKLTCDGTYVVPHNAGGVTKYPLVHSYLPRQQWCPDTVANRNVLGPNQACTLFGSTHGNMHVPGRAYLESGYGLNTADMWRRNFLALAGWCIFFWALQIIIIEVYPVSSSHTPFRPLTANLVNQALCGFRIHQHPR